MLMVKTGVSFDMQAVMESSSDLDIQACLLKCAELQTRLVDIT